MQDVIVVGAGIIGSTIASALRNQGRSVTVLDANKPLAGTPPSGGHLKPSWFGGMKKVDYEPAMELLDKTWGLVEEEFIIRPSKLKATIWRVDTDKVVKSERTLAAVTGIDLLDTNAPKVTTTTEDFRCRLLIVAAGVWCQELLPEILPPKSLIAKQGISFRYQGNLANPFIKPWAPYKQIVAHQQTANEIWIGEGSAILSANWDARRSSTCQERCISSLARLYPSMALKQPTRAIEGLRPYYASGADPCLCKQVGKAAWVVTGAGKLGTIAAGWAARRILDATS